MIMAWGTWTVVNIIPQRPRNPLSEWAHCNGSSDTTTHRKQGSNAARHGLKWRVFVCCL